MSPFGKIWKKRGAIGKRKKAPDRFPRCQYPVLICHWRGSFRNTVAFGTAEKGSPVQQCLLHDGGPAQYREKATRSAMTLKEKERPVPDAAISAGGCRFSWLAMFVILCHWWSDLTFL